MVTSFVKNKMNKQSDLVSRIFFSSDNELFVAKTPLMPKEREGFEQRSADEIEKNFFELLDVLLTEAVRSATPRRRIIPDFSGYKNELAVVPQLSPPPEGYQDIFFPCVVEDELVPEDMRKLGIKLRRKIQNFYMEYSPEDGGVVFFDEHGLETEDYFNSGEAETCDLEITFYTPRVFVSKEDYVRLKAVINKLSRAKTYQEREGLLDSLSDQDYALYDFYDYRALLDQAAGQTLAHELKHIKNNLLLQNRPYKKDYAAPNTTDFYLLGVEDERSAYLESLFFVIRKYLKSGNYADKSCFEADFFWLAESLENKSESEIKSMLYPAARIMNTALAHWNDEFLKTYTSQFKENLLLDVQSNPLALKDTAHKEYELERRLMYVFRIYNPYTKKEEVVHLADEITTPVVLTAEAKHDIIIPAQKERQHYHAVFKRELEKQTISEELLTTAMTLADRRYKKSITQQIAQKNMPKATRYASKTKGVSADVLQRIFKRLTRL